MSALRHRRRGAAVLLLVTFGGCEAGVTIPGFVRAGANRPPIITAPSLTQMSSGLLRLSATVFDPDADGLTIGYEQRSGPFAAQQSAITAGGAFSVLLQPAGDGVYAFRIVASDGFFEAAADVSLTIGPGEPARTEPLAALSRPVATGRYRVTLSGRAVASAGFTNFSVVGVLEIREPDAAYAGNNEVVVSLRTDASPFFASSPVGAVTLESAGSVGGAGNVQVTTAGGVTTFGGNVATQSSALVDLLDARREGLDLILNGPSAAAIAGGVSPGLFRTDDRRAPSVNVAAALFRLRADGDRVTGEVLLSSQPAISAELARAAEYVALLSGTLSR